MVLDQAAKDAESWRGVGRKVLSGEHQRRTPQDTGALENH